MANSPIFKLDPGAFDNLDRSMKKRWSGSDKVIQSRIKMATNMVWRIAHQKRPMITAKQAKAEGRSKRVSDPGATLGVPVDTGALQASIQQSVTKSGGKYIGQIWTKGIPYAGYMEYGTSKIAARPFMRPAIDLNREAIRRMLKAKIESNL
jgi:HK97 gp10 family phage protein